MRNVLTLMSGAAIFLALNTPAFAAWEPLLIDEQVEHVYTAETAGKSGNVKACFEQTIVIKTYQWTHTTTGKTRGTFDEETITESEQVANSFCEP